MPLIHFTQSLTALGNILTHGFAYVARPTKTALFLLPQIPLRGGREPQQFGMVCFRQEHDGECSAKHRERYGQFGIEVDPTWAVNVGAQPVHYIKDGSVTAIALKRLFVSRAKEVAREEQRYPGDTFRTMGYQNSAAARAIGAPNWADMIDLYQFTAPSEDEWEREWRVVQSFPNYSSPMSADEAVKLVSPPVGWSQITAVLKPPSSAIRAIHIPRGTSVLAAASIPDHLRDVPLIEEG